MSSVGMLGSFVGFSGNRGAGGRGSFLLLKVKIQQVNRLVKGTTHCRVLSN